jgi:hypothetical protein
MKTKTERLNPHDIRFLTAPYVTRLFHDMQTYEYDFQDNLPHVEWSSRGEMLEHLPCTSLR